MSRVRCRDVFWTRNLRKKNEVDVKMPREITNGMVLDELEVNLTEGVWSVFDAKLENVVEFEDTPTKEQLEKLKFDFGYSRAKAAISFDRKLIVITPQEVSGSSL